MFRILNQLIILLIFILVIFKLIGQIFYILGYLCVLQNFILIGNYVFRDLVKLQLIIWPCNFTKSWFLGLRFCINFAEFFGIPLVFTRGTRILFNYSCLFVIRLITGSGSLLGMHWLSRVEPPLFKQILWGGLTCTNFSHLVGEICTLQIVIFSRLRDLESYFCPDFSKTRLQFSLL